MAGTMEAGLTGLGRAAWAAAAAAASVLLSFPLNSSSLPCRISSTSLANRREMVLEVTCCECPISASFLRSSLVKLRRVMLGYFL